MRVDEGRNDSGKMLVTCMYSGSKRRRGHFTASKGKIVASCKIGGSGDFGGEKLLIAFTESFTIFASQHRKMNSRKDKMSEREYDRTRCR